MKPAFRWITSAWLGILLLTGSAVVKAAPVPQAASSGGGNGSAATAPQQPPYSLAEYNAYKAANDEQDPQKKIGLLDDFVSKYPNSALLPYVYRAYYLAYYQVKNYSQTLAYVDKLLALGDKIDLGSRLEALVARAQAYFSSANEKEFQTPEQYTKARDAAAQGLTTLAQWQKPSNMTDAQFAQQKSSIGMLFDSVEGLADSGLKDYEGAQDAYKAALMLEPNDAVTHYRLGVAYLQDSTVPLVPDVICKTLGNLTACNNLTDADKQRALHILETDGMWELARSIDLKAPGADQVQAYLRNQVIHFQNLGCDNLADTEVSQLLTLAQAGNAPPAMFPLPSADDLKKAQDDTGDFMSWLMEGGDHGKAMWLATCGLEYPDVPVRVMEVNSGAGVWSSTVSYSAGDVVSYMGAEYKSISGSNLGHLPTNSTYWAEAGAATDNVTLEVFRPSAADPDAASKEMDAAKMANMEVHVVGQPDAKRIMKDDYVRFTGTLSGYRQSPFLLTWANAKVNPEDIPAAGKPAPKRPPARPTTN